MDFYEIMQKAIDDATAETGTTEPERIFIDGVPFEKWEYTSLRHSKGIMNDFDLVLNLKRKGLAIAEELLPKSINGYSVRYIFELTPADFGYEDSFDVYACVSILSNRTHKSTAFSERRSYSLVFAKVRDGSVNKDFYDYLETEFRMIFERLLHAACRSANEYWRVENNQFEKFKEFAKSEYGYDVVRSNKGVKPEDIFNTKATKKAEVDKRRGEAAKNRGTTGNANYKKSKEAP